MTLPTAPRHIPAACDCGTALVLADVMDRLREEAVWTDEWTCPQCDDGAIRLDVPADLAARVAAWQ